MKLRTASFKNFKLLKDVRIDFGGDASKPLTVIRAENASGKTSLLNGLRWGLYGIKGLDRSDVRLSPADWKAGRPCDVEVQVEFDHTAYVTVGQEVVPRPTRYRLIRGVTETPASGNEFTRSVERVTLFELKDSGASPSASPEAAVAHMLPAEMKDIFFTDGDAALSFISSATTRGARRGQVKDAIRSLLGVGLLEDAQKHLKTAHTTLRARVAASAGSSELDNVETELEKEQGRQESLQKDLDEFQKTIKNLERKYEDADKALVRALQEGDHDELARRKEKAEKQKAQARILEMSLKRDQQRLYESESLSWTLMRPSLTKAEEMLGELHDRGVIPRTTIPVLKDRLELGTCICGTSLAEGSSGRAAVELLIKNQKDADEERSRLTRLFHEARAASNEPATEAGAWSKDLDSVEKNRLEMMKLQREAQEEINWCEQQIEGINKAQIEQKREFRETIRSQLASQQRKCGEAQMALIHSQTRGKALEAEFKNLLTRNKQDAVAQARLTAAQDTLDAVNGALGELQNTYVSKVSSRMNTQFLDMIGADPEQGGLFREARVTPEYDIAVYTRDGRTLDPEAELNGASKRALTFSFVWALTEVSGVVAPRIVDTPLGMMSGAVKERVLDLISQPRQGEVDKQVVLLLTRAEIAGTQDVLDRVVGKSLTLTNTIHYPKDLANKPPSAEAEVLVCGCDFRTVCDICQRRDDKTFGLTRDGARTP